ncbi:DUF1614 domain-containing protein [Anaerosinus massiliensis]|uniref:DUF1614 domain-containing protein n=1 Tax=Massilibacillus massiliensis TaxID=1806837 RepID=UPI000A883F2B|nr:DUF1614 domain-containing protein [Massilibacillus massiliensis]
MNMPLGMIALLVIGVFVYFGIAQRLLDRMRLTDKQAILFILAMVVGSFIDIPISTSGNLTVNVGGALLPALLSIWLMIKADQTIERIRAILAMLMVAFIVFLGSRYLPYEPENMFFDPKLIYGISAGIVAYVIGRSRRSAFIGGVLGIVLSDIIHFMNLASRGIVGTTAIGGAGVFDVVVIAGFVAIMMAELVGETREKLQGGHKAHTSKITSAYEFSKELGIPEKNLKKSSRVISMEERKKSKENSSRGGEHE